MTLTRHIDPRYEVTTDGRVLALETNWRGKGPREMSQSIDGHGYLNVRLIVGGKRKVCAVHRLVARAHLGPRPSPRCKLLHLDGNKLNNHASNLSWNSRKSFRRSRQIADADIEQALQSVRQLLDYDQDAGHFTWKVRRSPNALVGERAGLISDQGYVQIYVDQRRWSGHALAWFHVHGVIAKPMLDHINGDRSDNRIANLRIATAAINAQNTHKARRDSTSGLLGVSRDRARWRAEIQADGRRVHIGTFETPEEAHCAYLKAKRELHHGGTL